LYSDARREGERSAAVVVEASHFADLLEHKGLPGVIGRGEGFGDRLLGVGWRGRAEQQCDGEEEAREHDRSGVRGDRPKLGDAASAQDRKL
jgi:hypothetical protein